MRFTSDKFADQGVPQDSEGLTLFRDEAGWWRISSQGEYVDAYESEFEIVGPALRPRGVVLPSLNGGWLSFEPFQDWRKTAAGQRKMLEAMLGMSESERWGRMPGEDDFFGILGFRTRDDDAGFPVLWDRDRQLTLVDFIGFPDQLTGSFPSQLQLEWPEPELKIEGAVTIDPTRGMFAKKAAELEITLHNPIGDRTVSGHLTIPAGICELVSRWLADLFPAVTADDLDWT